MKRLLYIILLYTLSTSVSQAQPYTFNRAPLQQKAYTELPLGNIVARGWLGEMLNRQVTGATSQMDQLYPSVMGKRNGWLGGDGDQWERGPYWIDGLLPLAYLTGNKELQKKVQPWIEWTLASQREDGYFGPATDYPHEPGLQRNNSADWWPRMVLLKILQQYYSATNDQRVITFMTRYFRYQLTHLPEQRLGNWTFWAEYREADNLQAVYWLYNLTGERFLLELGNMLHRQGYDFTKMFLQSDRLKQFNTIHCVNLAQGLKEPVIYWQQSGNPEHLRATKQGIEDIRKYNGQPQGMFGGDEGLHGNNPTQGSELCSAMELMFSLEKMMEITGDIDYCDHLERIAFNALPTQITDDFMAKQYFQQPNQVMATRMKRNFYVDRDHNGTDVVFGTLTGYPCCFSNMHQGWPKFTQSLWMTTQDEGLVAMVYAPSEVTTKVKGGNEVRITEDTYYPMDDKIEFTIHMKGKKGLEFLLKLRKPGWCQSPEIRVNGEPVKTRIEKGMMVLNREWKNGDKITLTLPMQVRTSRWYENSIAVERGPLVYALRMNEHWEKVAVPEKERNQFGESYWQVTSDTKWNYALFDIPRDKIQERYTVTIDAKKQQSLYPWNLENAPITIEVDAREIPRWTLYNQMAGPLPNHLQDSREPIEKITLIPYGCTTLRISEFPVTN